MKRSDPFQIIVGILTYLVIGCMLYEIGLVRTTNILVLLCCMRYLMQDNKADKAFTND